ncbi:MAG: hypothetical protein ACPGOV_07035 [Magnetovibrionaceae bacterium]
MTETLPLSQLESLLVAGLLVNLGYMAYRGLQGSPVVGFIRLERSVRLKLKELGHQDDKAVEKHRRQAAKLGSGGEKLLGNMLKLSWLSVLVATLASFGMLLVQAFHPLALTPVAALVLIFLVWFPVPLSVVSVWALARAYLGRLESEMLELVEGLGLAEDLKEQLHGGGPEQVIRLSLDLIEGGGRRR